MAQLLFDDDLALAPSPEIPGDRLVHSSIDLGVSCNLDCRECPRRTSAFPLTGAAALGLRDLVLERARSPRADRVRVTLYGGEPLLHGDVVTGLCASTRATCERSGVDFEASVLTNGTLLDRANARKLDEAGVTVVQVSLAASRRVQDRDRTWNGRPTFDLALRNLDEARAVISRIIVRLDIDGCPPREVDDAVRRLESAGLHAGRRAAVVRVGPRRPYAVQARELWRIAALADARSIGEARQSRALPN